MKTLLRIDRFIAVVETALVVFLLGSMVLLSFTQVILRNVFSTGLIWADTFLRQLVLWVAFLGGSLAVQNRRHLNIDVLTRFMSERGKKMARLATDLFAGALSLLFFEASLEFVRNEMAQATTLFLEIPTWYFQLIIPIGYGLLSFRFLVVKVAEDLIEIKNSSREGS